MGIVSNKFTSKNDCFQNISWRRFKRCFIKELVWATQVPGLICWSDNAILDSTPFFSGTESIFFIFPLNQWIYNWDTIWKFKKMWKLVYMKEGTEKKRKKKMWNQVSCIYFFLLIWIKYSNFKMNRTSHSWLVYFKIHRLL